MHKHIQNTLLAFFMIFTLINVNAQTEVVFNDNGFYSYIYDLLGKSSGDKVYPSDMETITSISLNDLDISSIKGIEYAKNLQSLNIQENKIIDFSYIKDLKNISYLNFSQEYRNSDLLTLSSLTGFNPEVDVKIILQRNTMNDSCLRPLKQISNLILLDLGSNLWSSGEFTLDSIMAIVETTKLELENVSFDLKNSLRPFSGAPYFAAYIEEIEPNLFHLKGDVFLGSANNSKYFRLKGGLLIIDNRTTNKKVYYNGKIYLRNMQVDDVLDLTKVFDHAWLIMDGNFDFDVKITSGYLYDKYSLILESPIEANLDFGNYKMFFTELDIDHGWPNIVLKEHLPSPLNSIEMSGTLGFNNGTKTIRATTGSGPFNFESFAIKYVSINYTNDENNNEIIGGTMNIRIPGYTSLYGFYGLNGEYGDGYELLEFGTDVDFKNGKLDKLIVNSSVSIPLGTTGLSITKIEGGISNFASENWNLEARVDIETGLDLPVVGSPIAIRDFGVVISPFANFKGSGNFELFKNKVANGKINYNHRNRLLEINGNVDLASILIGSLKGSLSAQGLSGTIIGKLHTPKEMPWGFGWAADKDLSYCEATLRNEEIRTSTRIWKFNIAQEIKFGNPNFPYIHYSIGRNFESLTQILKASQENNFTVNANVPLLLVVAGNDIEFIDFTLTSPSGVTFDSNNTDYEKFEVSKQTVMGVPSPEWGNWTINTGTYENVSFEVMEQYNLPTAEFMEPALPDNPLYAVRLNYSSENPMRVDLYIDNDRTGFDGKLFVTYDGISGEGMLQRPFDYYGREDGEYFVYYVIDDSKNAPIMKYAPGSFNFFTKGKVDYIPQNLSYTDINDTLCFNWQQPADTAFNTILYLKDLKNETTAEYIIDQGVESFTIDSLDRSTLYQAYAKFSTLGVDPNTYYYWPDFLLSESSDILEVVLQQDTINNAPFFITPNFSTWTLIEGKESIFTLDAVDIDNDEIEISLLEEYNDINIAGLDIIWNPTNEDIGLHDLNFVISDAVNQDTLTILASVKPAEEAEIIIKVELNPDNPEYVLFEVTNNEITDQEIIVSVTNSSNGNTMEVVCYKTTDGEYSANYPSVQMIAFGALTDQVIITYHYQGEDISTTFVIGAVTGTESLSIEDIKFEVFPNPVKDMLYLRFTDLDLFNLPIQIYDVQGKVVYQSILKNTYETINTNNWESGVYFIRIDAKQQTIRKKLIKH